MKVYIIIALIFDRKEVQPDCWNTQEKAIDELLRLESELKENDYISYKIKELNLL